MGQCVSWSGAGEARSGSSLQRQSKIQPRGLEILDELVHHLLGVVRSGSDPELLLSAGHGRVVDGLDVVAVLLEQDVGERGAEDGVADVDRDDVRWRRLHADTGGEQSGAEIADIGLVAGSQLASFLAPQNPDGSQRSGKNSWWQRCCENES